jgi:hypothetical protein
MTDKLNEFDIPGISHINDWVNKQKGKQQAINISKVLMKKYMEYLGRNKLKANPGTIKNFFERTVEDGEEYVQDAMKVAVDLAKEKDRKKLDAQRKQEEKQQQTAKPSSPPQNPSASSAQPKPNNPNPGNPPNNGGGANLNPQQSYGKTPSGNSRVEPSLNNQRTQDSKTLTNDLAHPNPANLKRDLTDLHDLLSQANAQGGEEKQQVLNYLSTLRNNKFLQNKYPQFSKAIRGESTNRIVNFATFLVEYDLRSKHALNGALNFLYEDDPVYGSSQPPPYNYHPQPAPEPQSKPEDLDAEENSAKNRNDEIRKNKEFQDFLDTQLSRGEIMKILYAAATEMINSGDFYYDPNENKKNHNDFRGISNSHRGNTKPSNHNGGKPNHYAGEVKIDKFRSYLSNLSKDEKQNIQSTDYFNVKQAVRYSADTTVDGIIRYIKKNNLKPLSATAIHYLHKSELD